MDWTQIITTLIVAAFGGGGLFAGVRQLALVSAEKRKQDQENLKVFIDNTAKLIDQWQEIAEERMHRCAELKADLDKKDGKIEELYKTNSILRNNLDYERTGHAVAEILKCEDMACSDREPPIGKDKRCLLAAKINGKNENK